MAGALQTIKEWFESTIETTLPSHEPAPAFRKWLGEESLKDVTTIGNTRRFSVKFAGRERTARMILSDVEWSATLRVQMLYEGHQNDRELHKRIDEDWEDIDNAVIVQISSIPATVSTFLRDVNANPQGYQVSVDSSGNRAFVERDYQIIYLVPL